LVPELPEKVFATIYTGFSMLTMEIRDFT
jgi:hypothetical protein